jgi:hypothetical protein
VIRKTYIPYDLLVKIAREEGCTLEERTTCMRVSRGTVNKTNRLYIARTHEVNRVHVNGCKIPDPEIACTPPGGPVGTFVQIIRFDHDEAAVLANYRTACKNLDAYPPLPKKPRGRPAGFKRKKDEPIKGPDVEVKADETPGQHAERLIVEFRKKRTLSAALGYPMSAKTVADYRKKVTDLGVAFPEDVA